MSINCTHPECRNGYECQRDIQLIIKGNHDEARKAAAKHGVYLCAARQHEPIKGYIETLARAYRYHWPAIADWFCNDGGNGAPYPIGTLMWYGDANT